MPRWCVGNANPDGTNSTRNDPMKTQLSFSVTALGRRAWLSSSAAHRPGRCLSNHPSPPGAARWPWEITGAVHSRGRGGWIRAGIAVALALLNASLPNLVQAQNSFWRLDGNSGTIPGTQFLGTTDTNALELKVNNSRVLRIEPG